jgi:hypothetical protein
MSLIQQPIGNHENETQLLENSTIKNTVNESKQKECEIPCNDDDVILNIMRCEIEKILNSVPEKTEYLSLLTEMDDYYTTAIEQLLKIYLYNEGSESKANQNEKSESVSEISNDSKKNSELESLLTIIKSHSEKIFGQVHEAYQLQTNKTVEKKEFLSILASLQNEDDEDSHEEDDDDEKNEEDDIEEDDELDEEDHSVDMTEEEFSREIAEAFENIRRLGRIDGQRIAGFVRDTFCEINGREPELREIADVFSRIKHKLATEAKEDDDVLASSRNLVIQDDITTVDTNKATVEPTTTTNVIAIEEKDQKTTVEKFGLFNIDIATATNDEKEEILKYARNIVRDDLQTQATNQLSKLIGREPTKQEFNDMLVQLATTSLLDCNFESSDDCSDYNPDASEEKLQLQNDIQETTSFENANNEEREEATLKDKPILTTPVKNKGKSSRVDYYFERYNDDSSEVLVNKAISSFKKMHNRGPNSDEIDNIKQFLRTEKANLLNEDDTTENDHGANTDNQENNSFKLNFNDTVDID